MAKASRSARLSFKHSPRGYAEIDVGGGDSLNHICVVEGCGPAGKLIAGLCPKHYQRLSKHGTPEAPGIELRGRNPAVCVIKECEGKPKAKGLCARHYQRLRVHGDPTATQQRDVNPYSARECLQCGVDISHMRSNAVYCSRTCKTKDSDKRRRDDGRERTRDPQRYVKERERRMAGARKYYYKTQPRRLETAKIWRESNREKRLMQHNNRRARKYGNPGFVEVNAWEWSRILKRAAGKCTYCHRKVEKLVMDHVVPLARGGRHAPGNVTPACVSCNSSKSDLLVAEWKYGVLPPVRVRPPKVLPLGISDIEGQSEALSGEGAEN